MARRSRTRCRTFPARQTISARSRGPLTAILPLFPCRLQFPIPVGLNLLLMPGEHVLWRDIADGAVQTDVVVLPYIALHQTPRIFERERRARADALAFE
jgi:hypothetical protein